MKHVSQLLALWWSAMVLVPYATAYADCFMMWDAKGTAYVENGVCSQRYSPCGTFALPVALAGFDTGTLNSPTTPAITFNPKQYPSALSNCVGDVTPMAWMSNQCPLFSQQLISKLNSKPTSLSTYITNFNYGTTNMSGAPNMTGVPSTLMLSPQEQILFVRKWFRGALPIGQNAASNAMGLFTSAPLGFNATWSLSGTASACGNGAWYVGWLTPQISGNNVVYVVQYVANTSNTTFSAQNAKGQLLGNLQSSTQLPSIPTS